MTMAAHRKVGAFNESLEPWPTYMERLKHFFMASNVTEDEKKQVIFVSLCGISTYTIIQNLFASVPLTKLFEDIVTAAGKYFNPKPSSIVQHFCFNSRTRRDG